MTSPIPLFEKSDLFPGVEAHAPSHIGTGDMWPVTRARDGHLYTAAGDNLGMPKGTFTPMNFYSEK